MTYLPNEIIDKILQNYWSIKYKENVVNVFNKYKHDNNKNNIFLGKHIIVNIKDIHTKSHLHFYLKNINNFLNVISKDVGMLLFLKIINREQNGSKFESIYKTWKNVDCYDQIDCKFRTVSKYIITLINPMLRYEAFEHLKLLK